MHPLQRFSQIALLVLALTPIPSIAAEAFVRITSPQGGSRVDTFDPTKLVYEVSPGPKGDHIHVYVDGKEVGILRQLKGSYTLETLSLGQRTLCIKVVNKAHVPVGVERCVKVKAE